MFRLLSHSKVTHKYQDINYGRTPLARSIMGLIATLECGHAHCHRISYVNTIGNIMPTLSGVVWREEVVWNHTCIYYIFIVFCLIYVSHSNHKIKCSAFTRCWIKWQSVTVVLKQTGEQHYFATQLSDQRTINMLQLYQATPIIVAFEKLLHTCYIFLFFSKIHIQQQ